MKYGEFKRSVMQLIDQFSVREAVMTQEYNDQGDFFVRIPALYNNAMLEMAQDAAPLVSVMEPDTEDVVEERGFVTFPLPDDFLSMSEDGLPMVTRDGQMTRMKEYWLVGDGQIRMRRYLYDHATLEYCRQPTRLTPDPDENTELDGTIEMQTAAEYYVAAMLMLREDSFVYATLYNKYDDLLSAMKKRLRAERFFMANAYGPDYWAYES
jgi:hypothetical protein